MLVLDQQAVLDMAGSNGDAFSDNTLLLKGGSGDHVAVMDGWTAGAVINNPFGETGSYTTYTNGSATLLIQNSVAVHTRCHRCCDNDGWARLRIFGADVGDLPVRPLPRLATSMATALTT